MTKLNAKQKYAQNVLGWKTSHILKTSEDQLDFQLEMNVPIMKLAKDNNMGRNEYLFAIHGGGFPSDCNKPSKKFHCTKCGNYYKPAKSDKRFTEVKYT